MAKPRIIFVKRRRPGNAGLVRNILHGTGVVVGGTVGVASDTAGAIGGGIAAGYRAIVGSPDSTEVVAVEAPQTEPIMISQEDAENDMDDMLEGIEDILIRVQSDPKKSPDCRLTVADIITEINIKFRGEAP